jgi:hypothetical protein
MKVRSMRGKPLDVSVFLAAHGDKPAIGNAKMNARGDIIGPGGRVIKTSAQMLSEYNRSNPKAVSKQVSLKSIKTAEFNNSISPSDAVKKAKDAIPDLQQGLKKGRKLVEDDGKL